MSGRADLYLVFGSYGSEPPTSLDWQPPHPTALGKQSGGGALFKQPVRSCCLQLSLFARCFERPPDNLYLQLALSLSGRNRFAPTESSSDREA